MRLESNRFRAAARSQLLARQIHGAVRSRRAPQRPLGRRRLTALVQSHSCRGPQVSPDRLRDALETTLLTKTHKQRTCGLHAGAQSTSWLETPSEKTITDDGQRHQPVSFSHPCPCHPRRCRSTPRRSAEYIPSTSFFFGESSLSSSDRMSS